jgi:hypothetical protein
MQQTEQAEICDERVGDFISWFSHPDNLSSVLFDISLLNITGELWACGPIVSGCAGIPFSVISSRMRSGLKMTANWKKVGLDGFGA